MNDGKQDTSAADAALMISCAHGSRPSAVVCRHLLSEQVRALGFVENSDDPADLQAWCGDCEKLFLDQGGEMTPRFLDFSGAALVCDICYANIKTRHAAN